jgi:hypothetical protein
MNSFPVYDALYSGETGTSILEYITAFIYRVERYTVKYWHPTIKLP